MTTVGIIGSSGMLGSDLYKLLLKEKYYKINCYDFPEYDIVKKEDLISITDKSDIIINCAAYTAVDDAENNIAACYAVNSNAVEELGILSTSKNKYLIHISTDFVFGDESQKSLTENSVPNPLNIYGKSKLQGEKLLTKNNKSAAIIRIQWTYGQYGNHFISKILNLFGKFNSLKIVNDQTGSPTCTEDVAKAIICFINKKPSGIFHFASEGYASRYDTAKFIINHLNLKTKLLPCSTEEFHAPAQRPKNSRFDCAKIDNILDFQRPFWQEALGKFLDNNYK